MLCAAGDAADYGTDYLMKAIDNLVNCGCDFLGCTELPLLLNDKVSPVLCLDTMKIHVKALVDRIVV